MSDNHQSTDESLINITLNISKKDSSKKTKTKRKTKMENIILEGTNKNLTIQQKNLKLYPCKGSLTWRMIKGLPLQTKEEKEKLVQKNKLAMAKRNALREKRFMEYYYLDERQYFFTFKQYIDFLENENFDVEQCNIRNIREREEKERIEKEELDRQHEIKIRSKLRELKNHEEIDYYNYYYNNKPYIVNHNNDDTYLDDSYSNYEEYDSETYSDYDNESELND